MLYSNTPHINSAQQFNELALTPEESNFYRKPNLKGTIDILEHQKVLSDIDQLDSEVQEYGSDMEFLEFFGFLEELKLASQSVGSDKDWQNLMQMQRFLKEKHGMIPPVFRFQHINESKVSLLDHGLCPDVLDWNGDQDDFPSPSLS